MELLRQLPAGVQIDEVVEAEFLALELGGAGDAQARAVGVKRGALVGIFAVAQRLGEREVDAQGCRECCRCPARPGTRARELRRCWSRVLAMAVS